jgi:hypothetical protein
LEGLSGGTGFACLSDSAGLLGGKCLYQAINCGGKLGAVLLPVVNSVEGNLQSLLGTRCNWVVVAKTFNECTISAIAFARCHDVVEGAFLCTTP